MLTGWQFQWITNDANRIRTQCPDTMTIRQKSLRPLWGLTLPAGLKHMQRDGRQVISRKARNENKRWEEWGERGDLRFSASST